MSLVLRVAQTLAVLVLLAAFGVPSALAHEGHHHGAAQGAPQNGTASLVVTGAAARSVQKTELRATSAGTGTENQSENCAHCCCCSFGMTCCGAALAPEIASVPLATISEPVAIPRMPSLPGITPEALPKPPRSLS
jgi:hypothetical protein